jgi:predicted Holliday junction resolvase-like endonuclease
MFAATSTYTLAEIGIALGTVVTALSLLAALVKTVWAVARELAELKTDINARFTALAMQIADNNASANIAFAKLSAREDVFATKDWAEKRVREAIDNHCANCLNSPEHSKVS